jgi:hypothetical protein
MQFYGLNVLFCFFNRLSHGNVSIIILCDQFEVSSVPLLTDVQETVPFPNSRRGKVYLTVLGSSQSAVRCLDNVLLGSSQSAVRCLDNVPLGSSQSAVRCLDNVPLGSQSAVKCLDNVPLGPSQSAV